MKKTNFPVLALIGALLSVAGLSIWVGVDLYTLSHNYQPDTFHTFVFK